MSSELSPRAVHQILCFIEDDDRRTRKGKKWRAPIGTTHLRDVNKTWRHVCESYFTFKPPPPMDYLRSTELALFLRNGVDDETTKFVFGHGNPLVFDVDHPRMLLPKIIEQLKEEPSFLDVTLGELSTKSGIALSAVWPQAYIDYQPCSACRKEPQKSEHRQGDSAKHKRLVVEKFHIPSKHFVKQAVVELHFPLAPPRVRADTVRPATVPALEKDELRKVVIRLDNVSCSSGSPSVTARTSESLMLLPEFASEVYGFVDRAHVGTSLLANRGLNELIFKLRHLLPVHHLTCEFRFHPGQNFVKHGCAIPRRPVPWSYNVYGLILRHFQRDLSYSDSRRFAVPSGAGPAADCALVLRCLSNSHVSYFKTPDRDCRYAVKMLAALADRNVSIGTLRMSAHCGGLLDYHSLDIAFNGGMRLDTLNLSFYDHDLATLVKTTDFFRMSTIQTLKALKLGLVEPWKQSDMPSRWAMVNSPLWIAGIHLLRNSDRFEVHHQSERHLRAIGQKLVQLCEQFERGEISELVGHFMFQTSRRVAFLFNDDNKTASEANVGGYEWDVYRFRNAATGEWLTACVGHLNGRSAYTVLHIVKGGDVRPDASFAPIVQLAFRSR